MKCDTPMTLEEAKARLGIVDRQPIPMTNEEYLKSCNTEQLAEAIYYLTWFHTELDERLDKNVKNGCYNDDENIKIVMEWLKQPHTIKE